MVKTDSRGSWLHYHLRNYQDYSIRYKVIYKKGAGLKALWEIAERAILTRPVDLILFLGGVCDMTEKIYINGRKFYWPTDDMETVFSEINTSMKDIAKNYRILNPSCKFVFLPDPGLDLIRVNRIPHPVPWRELVVQEELENHLELLHLYTRALNSYMGSLTPWTLDVSHSHRNGNLRPVYDRMYDGLHFSRDQIMRLASEISRYSKEVLLKVNNHCLIHINADVTTVLLGNKEGISGIVFLGRRWDSLDQIIILHIPYTNIGKGPNPYICRKTISSDCHVTNEGCRVNEVLRPCSGFSIHPTEWTISSDRPTKARITEQSKAYLILTICFFAVDPAVIVWQKHNSYILSYSDQNDISTSIQLCIAISHQHEYNSYCADNASVSLLYFLTKRGP